MNCRLPNLSDAYINGYNAGKKLKDTETELKMRTEAFCALLPDFLAKENIEKWLFESVNYVFTDLIAFLYFVELNGSVYLKLYKWKVYK